MIIYSSPGTGKTTFCNNSSNKRWLDGDVKLFEILSEEFYTIVNDDNKKTKILDLFMIDKNRANHCYNLYYKWLSIHKYDSDILMGSKRFMWLADLCILKHLSDKQYQDELRNVKRWHLKHFIIRDNKFISDKLLKDTYYVCSY